MSGRETPSQWFRKLSSTEPANTYLKTASLDLAAITESLEKGQGEHDEGLLKQNVESVIEYIKEAECLIKRIEDAVDRYLYWDEEVRLIETWLVRVVVVNVVYCDSPFPLHHPLTLHHSSLLLHLLPSPLPPSHSSISSPYLLSLPYPLFYLLPFPLLYLLPLPLTYSPFPPLSSISSPPLLSPLSPLPSILLLPRAVSV